MKIDGKELIISPASFEDAMELKEIIAVALKENGIKIDLSSIDIKSENIDDIEAGDIGWILEPILTLTTDSTIRKHLFKCAERAMFDKNKVNADLFEPAENRKYYYPIMMEVLKINIFPFFGLVNSKSFSLPGLTEFYQKLKSKPAS